MWPFDWVSSSYYQSWRSDPQSLLHQWENERHHAVAECIYLWWVSNSMHVMLTAIIFLPDDTSSILGLLVKKAFRLSVILVCSEHGPWNIITDKIKIFDTKERFILSDQEMFDETTDEEFSESSCAFHCWDTAKLKDIISARK